ncbi:hypothetical protein, partial [Citrobacter freundii]|uniref:hypothetical protein n=1 Tax=Citrobacter freundii TaxID=546 RepID=UPI001EF8D1AA
GKYPALDFKVATSLDKVDDIPKSSTTNNDCNNVKKETNPNPALPSFDKYIGTTAIPIIAIYNWPT